MFDTKSHLNRPNCEVVVCNLEKVHYDILRKQNNEEKFYR